MKIYAVILLFLMIAFSCKTKRTCGGFINPVNIKSKVTSLKLIGIADTTIAYISGSVSGKCEKRDQETAVPGSAIVLTNKRTQKETATVSNDDGNYKLQLSAGDYDIAINGVSFNDIIILDVKIGTGYMIKLDVMLGNKGKNGTTSIYQMKEDRSLVEIQQQRK